MSSSSSSSSSSGLASALSKSKFTHTSIQPLSSDELPDTNILSFTTSSAAPATATATATDAKTTTITKPLQIVKVHEDDKDIMGPLLSFEVHNADISLVNAIRRTLLANIPVISIIGFPHANSTIQYIENTAPTFPNEIITQRLCCVPVTTSDDHERCKEIEEYLLNHVLLEVKEEATNETGVVVVTTQHIRLIPRMTEESPQVSTTAIVTPVVVTAQDLYKPFVSPTNSEEQYFIPLCVLEPGQRIWFQAQFARVTPESHGGMYNATSTCHFHPIVDDTAVEKEAVVQQKLFQQEEDNMKEHIAKTMTATAASSSKTAADVLLDEVDTAEFKLKNWRLCEAKRIVHQHQYQFYVRSVGVYGNRALMRMACEALFAKFVTLAKIAEEDIIAITPDKFPHIPVGHGFDIILRNNTYTTGHLLRHEMELLYFRGGSLIMPTETDSSNQEQNRDLSLPTIDAAKVPLTCLCYIGFEVQHPSEKNGILRVVFSKTPPNSDRARSLIKQMILTTIVIAIHPQITAVHDAFV